MTTVPIVVEVDIAELQRQFALIPRISREEAEAMGDELRAELAKLTGLDREHVAAVAELIRQEREVYPRGKFKRPIGWLKAFIRRHPKIGSTVACQAFNLVQCEDSRPSSQSSATRTVRLNF